MTAVSLGMPAAPAARRSRPAGKTRQLDVGGGAASAATPRCQRAVDDHDPDRRHQRHAAADRRADRVRLPDRAGRRARRQDDAEALPAIATQVADPGDRRHPLPAASTSSPRSTPAAPRSGSTRATSSSSTTRSARSPRPPSDAGIPIRIGVNAGSLDKRLLAKYGKATAGGAGRVGAVGVLAVRGARLPRHQDLGQAQRPGGHGQRLPSCSPQQCDYPLHLGVTEAGPAFQGTIKSAVAFGALLAEGIGDTIRVSLSAPPVEEVKVGNQILESLDLRAARPGDRLLPVLRPRPGRRLHAGRARSPPASRA